MQLEGRFKNESKAESTVPGAIGSAWRR